MKATLAAICLIAALLAAGCFGGGSTSSSPSSVTASTSSSPTSAPPPDAFDGEAALQLVEDLALRGDGAPRFRMPGTIGQTEGAAYLWSALDVPGWSRQWQNFTGQDYLGLDLSSVAGYGPGSSYCPDVDEQALPAWPFYNLLAIHRSANASAPLLLLGAHWDSQMHSDHDANLSRRAWPDPGANDGASGVGVLLQLMREVGGLALPFDVGVFLIDGEDGFYDCYPLAGALYFVQHPPAGIDVDRFLLLDMVGDPQARFARESHSLRWDRGLMDIVWSHGRAAGGTALFTDTEAAIVDDHIAFTTAGIPAIDLIDAGRPTYFPPQWDTSEDTVEKLSAVTLDIVGTALVETLQDPALSGPWPERQPAAAP